MSEESAVEHEHIRLCRQLEKVTHAMGVAQGSHKRLRTGIETALILIENGTADVIGLRRLLNEILHLDDQIQRQAGQALLKDGAVT